MEMQRLNAMNNKDCRVGQLTTLPENISCTKVADFVFDERHDFADFCVFHAASRDIGRFASMKDRNTVLAAGRKYK